MEGVSQGGSLLLAMVHPGSLSTAPDRQVPAEVVRVLGKAALSGIDAHVHIRSGIDSLLGDTHLVVIAGKLHVVARKTSLDPLEDVELVALPDIDEDGYRSVLQLRTTAGDKRVEIGATEENAVYALIGALPANALVEDVALANARGALLNVLRRMADDVATIATNDLDDARGELLAVLGTRLGARRAKLKADRARVAEGKRSPRDAASRILRAEVGRATSDEDGDGIPDPVRIVPGPRRKAEPTQATEPALSGAKLVVAVALVLLIFLVIGARLVTR